MSRDPAEVNEYPTDLSSLAAALVRIESENPPGNEQACAEYVYDWFDHHRIDATLLREPDPDRPQVGARVGTGGPTLVLNGHLDVVPAGDPDEWTYPPYDGVIDDGRLYGRGSVDMKTGVAIAMLSAYNLRSEIESGELDGSIVIHAAIGEETAAPGTKSLLEAGFDGDFGIVLEPTELRVATSEKGMAWYEIGWAGEPAHASRPDQGRNPIEHIQPVTDALTDYDARLRERSDPLCGQAYGTVTQVVAGADSNKAVLPDRAYVTLDRRILPEETITEVDEEVAELIDTLNREHGIAATWERHETYASAEIPVDHRLAGVVRDHSEAVADISPEPWGIKASTDVRDFVNSAGIPAITWGPGSLAQAHTIDEYVELAAAETGLVILERAARTLLTEDSSVSN
ncbi:acetylornithine deacetylase [Natronococcus pandeyae]|uniref:Acetylornithine deacetylase n=1 Tax=Natronococcus pandeyae TaxID=2055836 RepID=A0A8J8TRK8_9EURY|nr:ArgE/DapE family deacylase [Natronococcus pandeyae]TYL37824.1 acetylornithine deacetylase [Natronococcus pandeyae]